MRNRSRDYGNSRGYIRVDDGRSGSRSKYIIHFYSRNMVETVGGDGRCGYIFQTRHSFSHNLGYHVRLLCIPGSSRHVDDIIHENERCYSRSHGERRGSKSQEISHCPIHHDG